jgi:hypothetical protein
VLEVQVVRRRAALVVFVCWLNHICLEIGADLAGLRIGV